MPFIHLRDNPFYSNDEVCRPLHAIGTSKFRRRSNVGRREIAVVLCSIKARYALSLQRMAVRRIDTNERDFTPL